MLEVAARAVGLPNSCLKAVLEKEKNKRERRLIVRKEEVGSRKENLSIDNENTGNQRK